MRDTMLKIPGNPSNSDEGGLYENIAIRFGTTDKQKVAGRNAYIELLEAHARWVGGTSFLNQSIKSGHDLAVMAQILRDPRYETLRIFYTRMHRFAR